MFHADTLQTQANLASRQDAPELYARASDRFKKRVTAEDFTKSYEKKLIDSLATNEWASPAAFAGFAAEAQRRAPTLKARGIVDSLGRTDAALLPVFARELQYVLTQVIMQEYPDLPAANGDMFAINSSAPYGSTEWIQYFLGTTGVAKFVANNGTDRPLASLEGARISRPFHPVGFDYQYSFDDLEAAALMPGMRLPSQLAEAARRGHYQLFNWTLLYGASDLGIQGLINHPNITIATAADNGSGSTLWVNKTPTQILADVNALVNTVSTVTLGVYRITDVRIAYEQFLYIQTTMWNSANASNITILEAIQKAHPGVTFSWLNELDSANSSPSGQAAFLASNAMIGYARNVVTGMTAGPLFRTFPVQQDRLNYLTPCQSKIGGVKLDVPIAVSRMDGIG